MISRKITIFLIVLLLVPFLKVSAGTVLSSYKYAWGSNTGYINFNNVIVDSRGLSGYAWSTNHGWINFSPAKGGVLNDGSGNLSGYAWGESLGWINFGNVKINTSTGKFTGTATGSLVGTINFECPNYCDVRTDWRPTVSIPTPTYSGGGGSGGGNILSNTDTSSVVNLVVKNEPIIISSKQSGINTLDTLSGQIKIEIPANAVVDKTTFIIDDESLQKSNNQLVSENSKLVNDVFYNITATDSDGNQIHFFPVPITITLPLPLNLSNLKNLAVYWLNEVNNEWVLIPDAIISGGKAVFKVNHLTKFAIFSSLEIKQKNLEPSVIKIATTTKDTVSNVKTEISITVSNTEPKNFFQRIINSIYPAKTQVSTSTSIQNNIVSSDNGSIKLEQSKKSWITIIFLVLLFILIFRLIRRRNN